MQPEHQPLQTKSLRIEVIGTASGFRRIGAIAFSQVPCERRVGLGLHRESDGLCAHHLFDSVEPTVLPRRDDLIEVFAAQRCWRSPTSRLTPYLDELAWH